MKAFIRLVFLALLMLSFSFSVLPPSKAAYLESDLPKDKTKPKRTIAPPTRVPRADLLKKYPHLAKDLSESLERLDAWLLTLEPDAFRKRHPEIVRLMESPTPEERAKAYKAARALEEAASIPFLVNAVRHGEGGDRFQAVMLLSNWVYDAYWKTRPPGPGAEPFKSLLPLFLETLINCGDDSPPKSYCFQAAGCLADRRWLPLLRDLSESRHPAVTHWATWAIGEIRKRPIPPPAPPRRRGPVNEVTRLIDLIIVGRPFYTSGLQIFPLRLRRPLLNRHYLTLDEATRTGDLIIREKEPPSVNQVILRNASTNYVFILAGEIVTGGRQNRIFKSDLLLPPNSGPILVEVYCVERGRWVKRAEKFNPDGNIAGNWLRQRAQQNIAQEEVWREVEKNAKSLKTHSETQDLSQMINDPKVQEGLARRRSETLRCIPRGTVGLVVAHNGRIIGADIFESPALFQKLRRKIIDSYSLQATLADYISSGKVSPEEGRQRRPGTWPPEAADFLNRVYGASFSIQATPGVGKIIAISRNVAGSALAFEARAVHIALFQPGLVIQPRIR